MKRQILEVIQAQPEDADLPITVVFLVDRGQAYHSLSGHADEYSVQSVVTDQLKQLRTHSVLETHKNKDARKRPELSVLVRPGVVADHLEPQPVNPQTVARVRRVSLPGAQGWSGRGRCVPRAGWDLP